MSSFGNGNETSNTAKAGGGELTGKVKLNISGGGLVHYNNNQLHGRRSVAAVEDLINVGLDAVRVVFVGDVVHREVLAAGIKLLLQLKSTSRSRFFATRRSISTR